MPHTIFDATSSPTPPPAPRLDPSPTPSLDEFEEFSLTVKPQMLSPAVAPITQAHDELTELGLGEYNAFKGRPPLGSLNSIKSSVDVIAAFFFVSANANETTFVPGKTPQR